MPRSKDDSLEEDYMSKIFAGVRFVLVGFSPAEEAKVRSKLVNGGGTDVDNYSPECTHVIVDKIVYDDPACVVARNDGKTVVTALWIDHSLDVAMLVDATSILYRPVKDFDGIPGSKLLCVCLTGYQRQDRDDIMRMVGLMGAHFSKPLVANKVTHLICYKFEGEKYELAKKLKKIKLINHRWLEDCLRAWEILPECNYTKSGYELEIMEAEAKDSEEETEERRDTDKIEEGKSAGGPSNLQHEIGTAISKASNSELVLVGGEVPKILKNADGEKLLSNVTVETLNNHGLGKSPRKESHFYGLSDSFDKNRGGLREFSCQGAESYSRMGMSSGSCLSSNRSSPNLSNKSSGLTSNTVTAKMSLHSEAAELSNVTRKTPVRSPASVLLNSMSSNVRQLGECKASNGVDFSPPKLEQVNSFNLEVVEILRNESKGLHDEGDRNCVLPQKRKTALSTTKSESPTKGGSVSPKATASPSSIIRPEKLLIQAAQLSPIPPFSSNNLDSLDGRKSMENKEHIRKEVTPEASSAVQKETDLGIQPIVQDIAREKITDDSVTKAEEPQKQNGDVSQVNNRGSEIFYVTGMKEASSSRSLIKKTVARKNLGTKSKLSASNTDKQKGSLHLNTLTISGEATTCVIQGKGGENEKALQIVPQMMSASNLTSAQVTKEKALGVRSFENKTDDRNASQDEETEEPEVSKAELEKGVIQGKADCELKAHNALDVNLQGMLQSPKDIVTDTVYADITTVASREDGFDHPKAGSSKSIELCDLTAKEELMTGNKHLLSKSKRNAKSVVKGTEKTKNEDGLRIEMNSKDEKMKVALANRVQQPKGGSNNMGSSVNETQMRMVMAASKPMVNGNITKGKGLSNKIKSSPVSAMDELDISEKRKTALELEKKPNENMKVDNSQETPSLPNKLQNNTVALDKQKRALDKDNEHETLQDQDMVKRRKNTSSKSKKKIQHVVKGTKTTSKDGLEIESESIGGKMAVTLGTQVHASKPTSKIVASKVNKPVNDEKENKKTEKIDTGANKIVANKKVNKPVNDEKENKKTEKIDPGVNSSKRRREVDDKSNRMPMQTSNFICRPTSAGVQVVGCSNSPISQSPWFILSGHRLQRKEFQQVIKRLKGRTCRDSHNWSYQATHFIVPDPVRRTEKFFAAAASGRWILRTDYLTDCNEAGKFLPEEPYEWFKNGLSEDGAINLEAPRKWRLLRERTGHGALHGMRIIIYGECIAPPLETLKRVVKAGDGTILATSPPYSRFLESGIDFAVVSSSTLRVDPWVQEFMKHEIPCIVADYLVEYVCKPGYSLDRHVLYNTNAWAEKSFARLQSLAEEIIEASTPSEDSSGDISCQVCGSLDRAEVMLICGNESGSLGCGIGTHIDCCDPPLEAVPEEDWFCPKCSSSSKGRNITYPTKPTKKGSSSSFKYR